MEPVREEALDMSAKGLRPFHLRRWLENPLLAFQERNRLTAAWLDASVMKGWNNP